MSHDTHGSHDQSKEKKVSVISFKNSFWLVIIIVGLFVAALNFIKAESGAENSEVKAEIKADANATTERADAQAERPKQTEPSPPDSAFKASK